MKEYNYKGKTVIEIPAPTDVPHQRRDCTECFFRKKRSATCSHKRIKKFNVPDCVFDREIGEDVIYILKP